MFNPYQRCDRSHIHDVVYINSHQTVFHYVSHELLDRCRSCTLACRAGRLSLLLYSPAQDGKHIKCFPLRAELATNLTPYAARPGNPTYSSGQRSSTKKTRFPVGKRVFGRAVNVLGNYSPSLSLASSASSVSTSWLSSSSREAMSSLMAPLAEAFLSSIGAPRSSSSASA